MSPAAEALAVRIDAARTGFEMNEIAADAHRTRLPQAEVMELQARFAARAAEVWPWLVQRRSGR